MTTNDKTLVSIKVDEIPFSQTPKRSSTFNADDFKVSSNNFNVQRFIIISALISFAFLMFFITRFTDSGRLLMQGELFDAATATKANVYSLTIISDRDKQSKKGDVWTSKLMEGKLTRDPSTGMYSVAWNFDKAVELKGLLVEGKRGMELSELKRWNGKLYTADDRTGIVYEIMDSKVIARYILTNGDGNNPKGFKCEWMTTKDGNLIVGSIGKEWTTPKGEIINFDPMYIKVIENSGKIHHINWQKEYTALRKAVGVEFPGYMVHEAVEWSPYHNRWFFLPRRVSTVPYDDVDEIIRGSNLLISASPDFKDIKVTKVGTLTPTRGFSTMKFIPGRPNEIIALKSEETDAGTKSYVTVFTIDGEILLPETEIDNEKYEGLEISVSK